MSKEWIETLQIKKRTDERDAVACWSISSDGVAPNTKLEVDRGIMVVLRVDGQTYTLANSSTVFSLTNPGKDKKLFGGNKPYEKCEIFAIDQSSNFNAEWGLAGDSAIPCRDFDYAVDCKAIARGNYYYKITNYVSFINSVPFNASGVITREGIREFLRSETTGIIKSYLSSKVMGQKLDKCLAALPEYAEDILFDINNKLSAKGLSVSNFVIDKLAYDPKHEAERAQLDAKKMDVHGKKIDREGQMLELDVEERKAKDVFIPVYKTVHGDAPADKKKEEEEMVIFCSRCGARNVNSNYCAKCGEKLVK